MAGFPPRFPTHVGRSAEHARELRPGAHEERVGGSDGAPPDRATPPWALGSEGWWVERTWVGLSPWGFAPHRVVYDHLALLMILSPVSEPQYNAVGAARWCRTSTLPPLTVYGPCTKA